MSRLYYNTWFSKLCQAVCLLKPPGGNSPVTGITAYKWRPSNDYSTVYVGMDVHKENLSLCCYTNEKEQPEYCQKAEKHYSKVLNIPPCSAPPARPRRRLCANRRPTRRYKKRSTNFPGTYISCRQKSKNPYSF